ncbi:Metallo-dependent phosphatase-like protein [Scheffersomyces xylosifermentans]|uniref:Metallo-dependent phosphatase-like protein n=1 Tax=Scheffersomyces xylosifermentans TaxID=1304137 RepID=UPI00315CD498
MLIVLISTCLTLMTSVVSSRSKFSFNDPDSEHYWPPSEFLLSDTDIVNRAVKELHSIDVAMDLNECISCKMRLQVAKFLSLTRRDLVPLVFSTWCIEAGHDESQCHMNYGFPSPEYSSTGNDFTTVVSLMGPEGFDGDYFCYYHDPACHILPEPPVIDLQNLWPPKPKVYEAPDHRGISFNVLHISDVNIQLDYELLAESNCSQSLCCSSQSYNTEKLPPGFDYSLIHNPDSGLSFYDSSYAKGHFEKGQYIDQYSSKYPTWSPAHEFGSYRCDTPPLLFNNTMQTIRDFHQNHLDFEFAIFTGGTVDHSDRIFIDKSLVLSSQEFVYRGFQHFLPNVDFHPAIGTRDIFPLNQLPQGILSESSLNYQWQFDFLSDLWQELGWIDLETAKQIRYSHFGYSTVTRRGLKIISLNSNVWNTKNLYAFWDVLSVDSFGVWQFLIDELIHSEINEQRVWIIAHLPVSHQSLPIPTEVFTQIVERFSPKVIAAIFFGHIHRDEFNILYGGNGRDTKELEDMINFALIGPSISPYSGVNPAWRYYSVDEGSFSIVDSYTYFTKLNSTFANEGAEPLWEFAYSARDAYDPESLWPSERCLDTEWWHHVGEKIRDIPEFRNSFKVFEYRNSPFTPISQESEENCTVSDSESYCKVSSFTVQLRKLCMLTQDQDNYVSPFTPIDYTPYIKPFESIQYIGVVDTGDLGNSEQESYISEAESYDHDKEDNNKTSNANLRKSGSLRDVVHRNSRLIVSELRRLR